VRGDQCLLCTHDEPEKDIAPEAIVKPMHQELLDAIFHGRIDLYSTAWSLELAAALLHARDAADQGTCVRITE
jgi:hypothetical protein